MGKMPTTMLFRIKGLRVKNGGMESKPKTLDPRPLNPKLVVPWGPCWPLRSLQGFGFSKVQDLGFRVRGLGFWVLSLGLFRVEGLGFRA